jgi:hypothetical protein
MKEAPGIVCGKCAKKHGHAGRMFVYRDIFKRGRPHATKCMRCDAAIVQGDEYAYAIF